MNSDKLLSFLGLCRRAGKMAVGNDIVINSVLNKESCLIILAHDISAGTEKKLKEKIEKIGSKVNIIKISSSKEEMSKSLGKLTGVISINDRGFAKKIVELIGNNE